MTYCSARPCPYQKAYSYPSGLLAVIVVVSRHKGRVCIVYDDISAPRQPVRAVFQCDGREACYHSNGSIWLALNASGGQCLNDAGAKTRRWSWRSGGKASIQPIALMLNQSIGVRVSVDRKVFVSFLSRGQQAKFSVGSCCAQGEHRAAGSRPSDVKEEMLVLVTQMKIDLAIQHLYRCLGAPSNRRSPEIKLAPRLHVAARRLLEVGGDEGMTAGDKAFIGGCLKDC
ncbi:glutamate-rich protein 6-like [Fundulus diaphanus]